MKLFLPVYFSAIILISCEEGKKKNPENILQEPQDTVAKMAAPVSNYTIPDLSPMDMIYCPSDYAFKKMAGTAAGLPWARVIYSRPQKQGRKIFGELIKYNEPWRLGANEATEIEFFSSATLMGKSIRPGRYIMYCIPGETNWIFFLNTNLYTWGLKPEATKNILQFEAPVEKINTSIEYFTIAFENTGKNASLLVLWDDVKITLPITFK
jgi:hypothetical protein